VTTARVAPAHVFATEVALLAAELKGDESHEEICADDDAASGYRCIVAVHDTTRGPALGGTRVWAYDTTSSALADVLRLSRGMTYKCALAALPFGGGKAVILAPPGGHAHAARAGVFRAHGRMVERLQGRYITAADIGISPADIAEVCCETRHVTGLPDRTGDPGRFTARGVLRSLQAASRHLWGSERLDGRTVAVQGCGSVGYFLCAELHAAGARLIVTDLSADRARRVAADFGARVVSPHAIVGVDCDVFAPCALGGVLDVDAIRSLRASVVVGGANNQLRDDADGDLLHERGIVYVPDFVANAGGVITGASELLGWSAGLAAARIDAIYDTTADVLTTAATDRIPPYRAAHRMAEAQLVS
jgi:leucine dehydrogenase